MERFARSALILTTLLFCLTPVAWAKGKLVIALDPSYPPMESEDLAGKLVGFDIDFARELAKHMDKDPEFMVMSWEGIISGLMSNRYDVIISAMNITSDRKKEIEFVEYARMSQLFVAKPGLTVKSVNDLAGKIVAVATDTTSFDFLQTQMKNGLAIKELKAYRLASEVFLAVKTGHAEVLVVDEPVARYFTKLEPSTFVVTGRAVAPEPVGIGLRRSAKELKAEVAKAVEAMRLDGTMKRLSLLWFGTELGD